MSFEKSKLNSRQLLMLYREKDIMCMTSTRWLVGIYNDAANKSWSKYTTLKIEKLIKINLFDDKVTVDMMSQLIWFKV